MFSVGAHSSIIFNTYAHATAIAVICCKCITPRRIPTRAYTAGVCITIYTRRNALYAAANILPCASLLVIIYIYRPRRWFFIFSRERRGEYV